MQLLNKLTGACRKNLSLRRVVLATSFLVFALVFGTLIGIFPRSVLAGISASTGGFAWGGTEATADGVINGNETGLGWISMNSLDCDADKNGYVDTGACGGDNATTIAYDYGVNIPANDGQLTGYAWSENFGWISFNAADLGGTKPCVPPLSPATRTGNTITGGARILSIRDQSSSASTWDGCISLSDGATYGVSVVGSKLSGYVWSSDLGWIDMNNVTYKPFVFATTTQITPTAGGPTVSIAANPLRVRAGSATNITWSSSGAKTCSVSGPGLSSTALTGTQSVTINAQSVFVITCRSSAASATQSATVTVNILPAFKVF